MAQAFRLSLVLMALVLAGTGCSNGSSETDDPSASDSPFDLTRVFTRATFVLPLALVRAPGDTGSFYVVEKGGTVQRVSIADNGATSSAFFEDTLQLVDSQPSEAGLLGMAFHPEYANNQTVFLSYTRDGAGTGGPLVSYVSRYLVTNGTIDTASEQPVLTVPQPFTNHNGGQIEFGPDGYLYIGLGDGGSGGDPQRHGQNIDTLLGAMLRIDVNQGAPYAIPLDNPFANSAGCGGGNGCPEIFAWGLRNPWRWSFDRDTGELWLGDVGQSSWEEIDRVTWGGNYGWNEREGAHCYVASCTTAGLIDPVAEHGRSEASSITGGYVYRGTAIPALRGHYIYGDFSSGRIWSLATDPVGAPQLLLDTGLNIATFGEDSDGELYLVDYGVGAVYKLVPAP